MNRKNLAIRALSVLLCTLMLVGMIPVSVSAVPVTPTVLLTPTSGFGAIQSSGSGKTAEGPTMTVVSTTEDNIAFYRYTVSAGTITGNDERVNLPWNKGQVDFAETPYFKIGYRTNLTTVNGSYKPAEFFFALTTNGWRSYYMKRNAGTHPITLTAGTDWHETVGDMTVTTEWRGTNGVGTVNISKDEFFALAGDTTTGVRLFPFTKDTTIAVDSYFDVAYVAFFANKADAEAYSFFPTMYTVTYMNGDDVFTTQTVAEGSALAYPTETPTAPAGKVFTGWSVAAGTAVNANTTVNAVFADGYTVTFKVDGDTYEEKVVLAGSALEYPFDPFVSGKTFSGWDVPEGTIINADTIVNAQFISAFTVKFMADGGLFEEQSYQEGDPLVLPASTPVVEGKVFKYWIDAVAGTEVTADAEYDAYFENLYKVSFYAEEGEDPIEVVEIENGLTIDELPEAPAKKGYEFVEWSIEAGATITEDVDVYATYEAVEADVRVIYMLDEKNVFAIVDGLTTDVIADLEPAEVPVLPGYTFEEWDYASAEGVEAGADFEAIIGEYIKDDADIKVTATFTKNAAFGDEVEVAASYILLTPDSGFGPLAPSNNDKIAEGTKITVTSEVDGDTGLSYYHYVLPAETITDNSRRINLHWDMGQVNWLKTPYIKIGYRTNYTGLGDANLELYSSIAGGKYRRYYIKKNKGSAPLTLTDGAEWHESIANLTIPTEWRGTPNDGAGKNLTLSEFAELAKDNTTGFRLFPFGYDGGFTLAQETYFDISYVALFETLAEAERFSYNGSAIITVDGDAATVLVGQDYAPPAAPIVPNKTFSHYVDAEGNEFVDTVPGEYVVNGLTLTSVYVDAESFTINYYEADGTLLYTVEEFPLDTAIDHAAYDITVTVPEGQEFEGWFFEGTNWKIEDGYVVDRDLNLVACYQSLNCYVTYMVDGDIYASQTYNRGDKLELVEAPEIEGKDFLAWRNSKKQNVASGIEVNDNLILDAKYADFELSDESSPSIVFITILKMITTKKAGGAKEVAINGPVAVVHAASFSQSTSWEGLSTAPGEDGGKQFVHFYAESDVEMNDKIRNYLYFDAEAVEGVNWAAAPVVAIGYRTNSQIATMDYNPLFTSEEGEARIYGNARQDTVNDGAWHKLVVNNSVIRWTGGDKVQGNTPEERFEFVSGMNVKGICLKPFETNGNVIAAGSYCDIEYVAFFKTVDDANAYVYTK